MCRRRRLRGNPITRKRQIIIVMHPISGGVDNRRGDKDQQILLLTVGGLALKQASDKGQVTQNRHLIFNLGNGLGNHSTEDNRLPVPDIAGCDNFTNTKMRQRQHRRDRDANRVARRCLGLRHKAAGTVVTDEFQKRGYQYHLDGITVR